MVRDERAQKLFAVIRNRIYFIGRRYSVCCIHRRTSCANLSLSSEIKLNCCTLKLTDRLDT